MIKKLSVLLVTLLLSAPAFATWGDNLEQSQSASAAAGAAAKSQSQSASGSESQSESSSSSDNAVEVQANTYSEETASSAASLYSAGCQVGFSAQGKSLGGGVITEDRICELLKLADAENSAANNALKECKRDEAFKRAVVKGEDLQPEDVLKCTESEKYVEHIERRDAYLDEANHVSDVNKFPAMANKVSANLALPAVFLFLLFLL